MATGAWFYTQVVVEVIGTPASNDLNVWLNTYNTYGIKGNQEEWKYKRNKTQLQKIKDNEPGKVKPGIRHQRQQATEIKQEVWLTLTPFKL